MTIRLGLIGCGKWGSKYLSASDSRFPLKKMEASGPPVRVRKPLFEITHVSRVEKGVEERMGRGPLLEHVVRVPKWKDMAGLVDAIVVATPPDSHFGICRHFLELGIPVMVEKPMTLDLESSVALEKIVKKAGIPFLVNHLHLFSPAYLRLRDTFLSLKKSSEFVITSRARGFGPMRSYSSLWDYGPHDLSMLFGLGLGLHISSYMTAKDGKGTSHLLSLKTRCGTASVDVSNGAFDLSERERYFEVFTGGVRMSYDDIRTGSKLVLNGRPVKTRFVLPLDASVTAFALAVKTGETDWRFGTDVAVSVARVLSACG